MKPIVTTNAPGAIGPYSQGYEVNGLVYTSGQIPVTYTVTDEAGNTATASSPPVSFRSH